MSDAAAQPRLPGDAGRDAYWVDLLRSSHARLTAVARRTLHCEHESADAVQDALLSAVRSFGRFEGRAAVETWLFRVVVNAALTRRRARARRRAALETDRGSPLAGIPDPRSASPEATFGRAELCRCVEVGLDLLTPSHRQVLVFRDIRGLGVAETARRLGVSKEAVRARHFRARAALRAALEPLAETVLTGAGG